MSSRKYPPGQLAELRRRRYAVTRANGGVAPVRRHNYVTRSNWGCGCARCLADYRRMQRTFDRNASGVPRRADITQAAVTERYLTGLSMNAIARDLGCSRDAVRHRLIQAGLYQM